MRRSVKYVVLGLATALSSAALAQEPPGQSAQPAVSGTASVPGQAEGGVVPGGPAAAPGGPGGPGITQTQLTWNSYPIAAGASAGNLEGAACPANLKMISGACHPFYNDHVVIINQFPDIAGNTWRCGFKNNTAASVTVYIYTLCGQ